jgi:UDP:flavonoid glycosyltransferase YjiC (YdhE family)
MPAGLTLPRWAPRPLGALYWRAIDAVVVALLGKHLQALCTKLELPPVRRFFQWWLSPQLVIGMFPSWYGPPQPDWPPQCKLVGFPRFDATEGGPLAADVAEFCAAGDPPVAFTFGTGMMHAASLFRAAAQACRILGARAIFLTRYAHQLPAPLPPSIRHVSFAPFRELFPRCGAIVHHGGVGTLAEGLAAGVPQLILPVAYDQTDNATRVRRIGAGEWISAPAATGERIARALARLLSQSPQTRARLKAVAARFAGPAALDLAALHVEQLAKPAALTAPPVTASS